MSDFNGFFFSYGPTSLLFARLLGNLILYTIQVQKLYIFLSELPTKLITTGNSLLFVSLFFKAFFQPFPLWKSIFRSLSSATVLEFFLSLGRAPHFPHYLWAEAANRHATKILPRSIVARPPSRPRYHCNTAEYLDGYGPFALNAHSHQSLHCVVY